MSFVGELEARCQVLPLNSRLYPLLPRHECSGIRRMVHGNYLIFYRLSGQTVKVLHILHGAMDYEKVLFGEQG